MILGGGGGGEETDFDVMSFGSVVVGEADAGTSFFSSSGVVIENENKRM